MSEKTGRKLDRQTEANPCFIAPETVLDSQALWDVLFLCLQE